MKTILITGYDDRQKAIGDLTAPIMKQYADAHGWDFDKWTEVVPGELAPWMKVMIINTYLDLNKNHEDIYTHVVWMDADVMITNMKEIILPMDNKIHVSRDWGKDAIDEHSFSTGVMVINNSVESKMAMRHIWQIRGEYQSGLYEQDALRDLSKKMASFTVEQRRVLNAVPKQVSPEVQEPWEPGDWLCHITMVPVERKVEIFHEIMAELQQPKKKEPTLVFRHGANIGDIIYSLWSVREACRRNNMKATYLQWLNRPAHYYEGAEHPTRNGDQMVSVNQKMFDMIKPLVEALPFIESFEPWNGERAISLDRIRDLQINMPFGDIRHWYHFAYPDMTCDIAEPLFTTLHLTKLPQGTIDSPNFGNTHAMNAIIVNRTSRYNNPRVNYGFLNNVNREIWFAGTMDEYNSFQNVVPKAKYLHVNNFLELAWYIGTCKVFIGNQSFCFALAEAMKTKRILEVCSYAPNVIPCGPNGYQFYDQQAFELLVEELTK